MKKDELNNGLIGAYLLYWYKKGYIDIEIKYKDNSKEIEKLSQRDKEIIEYRYGLNGKKELTQKEVASLMGISQSYISRIEKKVIKKLQTIIKM